MGRRRNLPEPFRVDEPVGDESRAIDAVNAAVVPETPRKLPQVAFGTYLALQRGRLKGVAGFNYFITSSRLNRAYMTVSDWDAIYAGFMARPTR